MPPRNKLTRHATPGTGERVEKKKISGWKRSKIFVQDCRMLKNLGLFKNDAMRMPGDESTPHPPQRFRRANVLERKLEASEKARKKAEKEAAGVEDLRKILHAANNALSEKETEVTQREADIIARFETQSARFSKRIGEHYTRNQELDEDRLLDTLTILELNCGLARDCLKLARTAFERIFLHFSPKNDLPARLCGPSPEGLAASPKLFPGLRVARRCSPVGFDRNTFWHARGQASSSTTSPSTSEMADGTPVTYEDLTDELKKKYDEVKAILEADLIGSFHNPFPWHQVEGVLA
ncbi:hypothetical protein QYE76_000811 [Lolium multiflorum]|uniref:Uncharacterized protein n=1 Tax=Lolium multiflorum TaxID=4521 RepID=A0AAD8RIA7_LOLMU|nr:hypothetical protein QYE76_000811 [Lolium multiflorum]